MNLLSVDGNFISSLALCYVHVTTDMLPTPSIGLTESPALRNFLYIASVGGDTRYIKIKSLPKNDLHDMHEVLQTPKQYTTL